MAIENHQMMGLLFHLFGAGDLWLSSWSSSAKIDQAVAPRISRMALEFDFLTPNEEQQKVSSLYGAKY